MLPTIRLSLYFFFSSLKNLIFLLVVVYGFELHAQSLFYAYHTKVAQTATDYVGKYADLIIVLGEGKQLEFTRQTNYVPLWRVLDKSYRVDEFFPERTFDYSFEYSFVRLLEEGPDKIVVHWRYVPDISILKKANENIDPLFIKGFTNVVHEIFTIYPTGKVLREVLDARSTSIDAWENPKNRHEQIFLLTAKGIEHGRVAWSEKEKPKLKLIPKNKIIEPFMNNSLVSFSFDEGGGDFGMFPYEDWRDIREVIYGQTVDNKNNELIPIKGHGALYKKGVSGTALAFDGYYTGVITDREIEKKSSFTVEGWIALDVYPFNEAPIIHKSSQFGKKGFYLGIDAYGHPFITINGIKIEADLILPLYTWSHLAATVNQNIMKLYVDGQEVASAAFNGTVDWMGLPLMVGINNSKRRGTDYVRTKQQNIPFIYGIQGLMDEVYLRDEALSPKDIKASFEAFLPGERESDLKKAVLPGEVGLVDNFGATYKKLSHHEIWDRMWRLTDYSDIVVKFEGNPASIVYWHGTNHAANYVVDGNRWMSDQSSEIWGKYGCSEHMADKQGRHSYVRLIENNAARVVVHWRYPCVDVGYVCANKRNWSDEYHTIYPDGTAIRKVIFNNANSPGFQDIQFLTNPGESALDVVYENALTVANLDGEIAELKWEKPNINPIQPIEDATIEWLNTKSEYKIFTIFQGPGISTWGDSEQSMYTDDPFAGPWNHWPISLIPSDGRFAVAQDRVTHFAIGANDDAPIHESMVHYGFTKNKISEIIPIAKYWQNPPNLSKINGAQNLGFKKEEKAYYFDKFQSNSISFTILSNENSPVINPVFVIKNCNNKNLKIKINGKVLSSKNDFKIGRTYDENGKSKIVTWVRLQSSKQLNVELVAL
jgi:hypothetical protein